MVQGIKHPLSNKVFIGLERKIKSFNLLSNKVFIGLERKIKSFNLLSNKVFIGLERKMKSFNLLSNKVLICSVVQGIQLDLSNKVLIGSRSRFAHAAQNRVFILLCSFPRTLRMLSNRGMYSLL